MTVLLDSGVLAALVIAEHEQHERATRWLAKQESFAITAFTEAAIVRFLLRLGESPQTATTVLAEIRRHPRCTYWPSDLSFTEVPPAHLDTADNLIGSYLVTLAAAHGEHLATLDEGLAARFPDQTTLLPA